MTSRQYDTIDDRIGSEIQRLHKKHPKLGHEGLINALKQANVHVDPQKLALFMKDRRIRAERPWRPWQLAGLPRWMGGPTDYPGTRTRWRLWRR